MLATDGCKDIKVLAEQEGECEVDRSRGESLDSGEPGRVVEGDLPGEVVVEEEVEVETSVTATVHNVFENVSTDEWDYEAELAQRKPDEPFIIHQDEYFADEQGYEKKTYHYYVSDNILTDIVDTPVYQHEKLVGELKFGHGSTDKNVCYVRNPALEMDMEVLRNEGSYEQEVLGIIPEPDESRTPRKFRDD